MADDRTIVVLHRLSYPRNVFLAPPQQQGAESEGAQDGEPWAEDKRQEGAAEEGVYISLASRAVASLRVLKRLACSVDWKFSTILALVLLIFCLQMMQITTSGYWTAWLERTGLLEASGEPNVPSDDAATPTPSSATQAVRPNE
jgi:hypothetical protein